MVAAAPPQSPRFHDALTLTPAKLISSAHIYRYKVESFQHFGTVTCNAHNSIGQSGPCFYHVIAAEIPDPVRNCTVSNTTANSLYIACEPGRDGGIQQNFNIDIFDTTSGSSVYNTSYKTSSFLLKRLPSDSVLLIKVTAYNLQGSSATFRIRTRTLTAPLLRTGKYHRNVCGIMNLYTFLLCSLIYSSFGATDTSPRSSNWCSGDFIPCRYLHRNIC